MPSRIDSHGQTPHRILPNAARQIFPQHTRVGISKETVTEKSPECDYSQKKNKVPPHQEKDHEA